MARLADKLYAKGREFLEVEYPFICGAMTWVSEPKLVAAVSNQGGFGCLAGGNTPVDILEQQIEDTRALTDKPFGVNLITIAPAYKSQLEMVTKKKLRHIIFAGGFPNKQEIQMAKDSGAKVMCFASTVSIANRMIKYGADALVLDNFACSDKQLDERLFSTEVELNKLIDEVISNIKAFRMDHILQKEVKITFKKKIRGHSEDLRQHD